MKIINNDKNKGTLLARKIAVLQAKGKYIVFVDSDDMLHSSNALAILYQMIETEDVDILQFNINLLFPDGTTQLGDGWFQLYEKNCPIIMKLSHPVLIINIIGVCGVRFIKQKFVSRHFKKLKMFI